jgi:sulfur relay (sulfurtransferase) DsrF/TusC family protein
MCLASKKSLQERSLDIERALKSVTLAQSSHQVMEQFSIIDGTNCSPRAVLACRSVYLVFVSFSDFVVTIVIVQMCLASKKSLQERSLDIERALKSVTLVQSSHSLPDSLLQHYLSVCVSRIF